MTLHSPDRQLLPLHPVARWIAGTLIVLTAVAAPLLLILRGHELRQWWHDRQAVAVAAEARALLADGRKAEALSVLGQVRHRRNHQPFVLRTFAQAAETDFPGPALDTYRDLESQDQLTPEDEARMAVLLVRQQDRMDGVLRLNRLITQFPDSPPMQQARADVVRLLEPPQILPPSGKATPPAGTVFAQTYGHPSSDSPQRFRLRTPAQVEKELRSVASLFPAPTAARRTALREALATLDPQASLQSRVPLVTCLKDLGEHRLIIDFISRAEALASEALFTTCVDALIASGRHKEAASLASAKSAPIPISTQWTVRALVELSSPTPDRQRASDWLRTAIEAAQTDGRPTGMEAAGHVALDHDLPVIAAEAFAQALLLGTGAATSILDYIAAARRAHVPASTVAALVNSRARHNPLSADLARRAAYFHLLTGEGIELVAHDTTRWLDESPDDPYARLIAAFTAERLGDTARAVELLTHLPPCEWHPGEVAVIAGLAARAGRISDAVQLARTVTSHDLFAEELAFLNQARITSHLATANR